jgi:hypothetical protein
MASSTRYNIMCFCWGIPVVLSLVILLWKVMVNNSTNISKTSTNFSTYKDIWRWKSNRHEYCELEHFNMGASWPWSYGSWIYNYLCNQCLSPLMLWIRISIRARCTTLCDKVYWGIKINTNKYLVLINPFFTSTSGKIGWSITCTHIKCVFAWWCLMPLSTNDIWTRADKGYDNG